MESKTTYLICTVMVDPEQTAKLHEEDLSYNADYKVSQINGLKVKARVNGKEMRLIAFSVPVTRVVEAEKSSTETVS